MIKFIHKKHMRESDKNFKFVIYYNVSDIFLGAALLILVAFFIHDYLSRELSPESINNMYMNQAFGDQVETNSL